MSKIAVLIDDLFEDVEYTKPTKAYKNAGHEIIHLGLKQGKEVKGKKQGTMVEIDSSIEDSNAEDFDALFIPGGYSPDKLRAKKEPVNFVKDFVKSKKPVFIICHGAQLLITAKMLKDRKVTGWKSIKVDIENAGAEYVNQEVVVDNNIISSRSPGDLSAFINETLEKINFDRRKICQ